jgi:hypothetical protein
MYEVKHYTFNKLHHILFKKGTGQTHGITHHRTDVAYRKFQLIHRIQEGWIHDFCYVRSFALSTLKFIRICSDDVSWEFRCFFHMKTKIYLY